MSADSDALLGAMQAFINEGHSIGFSPTNRDAAHAVQGIISGPTGSRAVIEATVAAAAEALVVAVVSARLAGEIKPASTPFGVPS